MDITKLEPEKQIVEIMHKICSNCLTTATGGNLSVRGRDGSIWITLTYKDKARLGTEDIVKVDINGKVLSAGKPTMELPMHLEIYKRRPDIRAILHAHPARIVAKALRGDTINTDIMPLSSMRCGKVENIPYFAPGSEELAKTAGEAFEFGGSTAMLASHGIIIGAADLQKAFLILEAANLTAEIEQNAAILGAKPVILADRHLALHRLNVTLPLTEELDRPVIPGEQEARVLLAEYVRRAYNNKLFLSGNGAFSVRTGDDSFLITPCEKERADIGPEELVLVRFGKREEEKTPSNSAALHRQIYLDNPEIGSIMISHPRCTMAYAVTDRELDVDVSYEYRTVIGRLVKIPFGSTVMQPKLFSRELYSRNSVYIVENDCMITTGGTPYEAYRKAEAVENCAEATIYSLLSSGKDEK